MKKTIIRLICLALAVFMVFGMAGCGSKDNSSFSEDAGDFDLDFGGNKDDAEVDDANVDTDADDAGTNDNNGGNKTSDGAENTTSKSGKNTGTSSDKKSGTVKAATIPNADSLTWNQLVSQMPSSLRGTTITFYNWNPVKEFTGAAEVISKFEKQTGIKVKWVTGGYDDYDAKIAAMVNSGSSPDIIRFRDANVHRMYLCQDVKSATGYDFSGKIWDKQLTDYYTVKNKVYAVNRQGTLFNQPFVLIYRPSMIEKYKIDDPYTLWKKGKWTWDTFINILKKYKSLGNAYSTPWCTNMAIDYLYFTGNSLIKFDGKQFKNNIADKKVTDYIKKMCDYRKAEYIGSAMRDYRGFEGGNCLFLTFSAICTRKTNAWFTDSKRDGNLACVPIPKISGAEKVQWFSEIEAYGIPKGAKNGKAVYYFLRYFLDPANYDANTFFCNKQAYDVYKYSMAKGKYFTDIESPLLDAAGKTGGNLSGLSDFVRNGGDFAQYTTERNRVKGDFDLAVKKANQIVAKFK